MSLKESAAIRERRKIAAQRKKEIEKENKVIDKTCGMCKNGSWRDDVSWNLDLNGDPITKRCPYYDNGKSGVLRCQKACDHFKSS